MEAFALKTVAEIAMKTAISRRIKPAFKHRSQRKNSGVHSDSRKIGSFENGFWPKCEPGRNREIMKAARQAYLHRSEQEPSTARLTLSAVHHLGCLIEMQNWSTGAIECSLDELALRSGLSRQTILTCNQRLIETGFLEVVRRYRIDQSNTDIKIRYVQAVNAYRVKLPHEKPTGYCAAATIHPVHSDRDGLEFQDTCPVPDDIDHQRQANEEAFSEMILSELAAPRASCEMRNRDDYTQLMHALRDMQKQLTEAESASQTSESKFVTDIHPKDSLSPNAQTGSPKASPTASPSHNTAMLEQTPSEEREVMANEVNGHGWRKSDATASADRTHSQASATACSPHQAGKEHQPNGNPWRTVGQWRYRAPVSRWPR